MPQCRGHLKQKEFFKRALDSEHLSHGYIFSGVSGIGKKLFALNIAKSLLCLKGSFFSECDCSACTQVENGTHPDLHIYGGKELKVENIRSISEYAGMTALLGKWKIFILDEAEVLSSSSQVAAGNALLKTLEEPGENTVFFLITSKYDMILPTIRSRCNNINFAPLSKNDLEIILAEYDIFDKEIIEQAGGSVSRAIFIKEQDAFHVPKLLIDKNFKEFTSHILGLTSKDEFKHILELCYPVCLEKYRESGVYSYCQLGDYILDIIRRLNFNINMDIVKGDFISKSIEVFSERI